MAPSYHGNQTAPPPPFLGKYCMLWSLIKVKHLAAAFSGKTLSSISIFWTMDKTADLWIFFFANHAYLLIRHLKPRCFSQDLTSSSHSAGSWEIITVGSISGMLHSTFCHIYVFSVEVMVFLKPACFWFMISKILHTFDFCGILFSPKIFLHFYIFGLSKKTCQNKEWFGKNIKRKKLLERNSSKFFLASIGH